MLIVFILLGVATAVYLTLCTRWDLKEREIYTFPSIILSGLWMIFATIDKSYSITYISLFFMAHSLFYLACNHFKLWGGGDSDMLSLLAGMSLGVGLQLDAVWMCIAQCLMLAIVLVLAFIVALIESVIKKKPLSKGSKVALAPGFAIVSVLLLIGGVWLRW